MLRNGTEELQSRIDHASIVHGWVQNWDMDSNGSSVQPRSMNGGTLVAVLAAVLFGAAQFLNAAISARLPGVLVARWTLGSAALMTGLGTAILRPDLPVGSTLWALLAGAGSALGAAALYRSLELGSVSVAIPLCTTTTTAIPVAVGLLVLGEGADLSTAVGLLAALAAILLVSSSRQDNRPPPSLQAAGGRKPDGSETVSTATNWGRVGLPLLAGVGFAVELVGISRFASEQAIPLLWVTFVVAVLLLIPARIPEHPPARRRDIAALVVAGVLTATAMIAFHRAAELAGLSTAGVIVGLYPVVPVALAITLLGERPGRAGALGLLCAAVAVLSIGGR